MQFAVDSSAAFKKVKPVPLQTYSSVENNLAPAPSRKIHWNLHSNPPTQDEFTAAAWVLCVVWKYGLEIVDFFIVARKSEFWPPLQISWQGHLKNENPL